MRRLLMSILLALVAAPVAQAKEVKAITPLAIAAGQPIRITGMDLDYAPKVQAELAEGDAKAARKRADQGLPPLDGNSYPDGLDGAAYATMPFKQMFPLVVRDVVREWRLDEGRPVFLRISIDYLKTADAAVALLVGSMDMLQGKVDVIDPASGQSLGAFKVEIRDMKAGWADMLVRGGGIREKLAERFALAIAKHMSGRKTMAG
ncbi:hypothetical protein U5A82_11365 [Sphingobium sp. CR2-8]|uniref:hypothetical protein n=1 Tax=Sphingobium sp. CR2-8 TaxID=1306534 RepID=UPI002DB7A2C1|nr:hypothetical protein [Sphingobium sp. CR2-8]MEC3911045.1 hypothetical protein [Sphingobium sp. CR2-8]